MSELHIEHMGEPWHPRMLIVEQAARDAKAVAATALEIGTENARRTTRIERALFGHEDEKDATVWIDGLLQKLSDQGGMLKVGMRFFLWAGIPMAFFGVVLLILLVAHVYNWHFIGELLRGLEGK